MERTARKVTTLRQAKLFSSLTAASLTWLAARADERRFGAGEMLFLSGEAAEGLYVIAEGKVRAFQQNSDGREQVMHSDIAGATLGDVPVFDDGPYPSSAVAEMDSVVLFIGKECIRHFCLRNPEFTLNALKIMAERVRRHARLVNILSLHEVDQRLALLLLTEAEKLGVLDDGQIKFRLNLSNHEIATRIGSVRDVVSRARARLQQLGLVTIKGRNVAIVSPNQLKIYADSHRHLHAK